MEKALMSYSACRMNRMIRVLIYIRVGRTTFRKVDYDHELESSSHSGMEFHTKNYIIANIENKIYNTIKNIKKIV